VSDPAIATVPGVTGTDRSRARTVRERVAVLIGLTGLAIAQPVLDLMGRHPQFFLAGHYRTSQIIAFGVAVTVLPAVGVALVLVLATLVHQRAGRMAYVVLLGTLGALFGNVLARGFGLDGVRVAVVATALGALGVTLLERARAGRMLLGYLAAANILFLGAFLLGSPTSRLFDDADGELGKVSVPELPGPVIVIIMDEFPVTTLMRSDGTINAERFPRFAELAQRATWFPNASSHASLTDVAVPSLLTGMLPARGALPDHRDHPRNLLALLARGGPVDRYELVTDLCPPSACDPPEPEPLTRALRDASVVFGHRVLPARLRTGLPAIDHAWGDFGDELGGDATGPAEAPVSEPQDYDFDASGPFARWRSRGLAERSAPSQAAVLQERSEAIGAEPGLHLIHVALPHYPWILSPWGTRLMEYPKRVEDPADPAFEWSARTGFQLQSMQAGAADVALGGVLDHLDEKGLWDDTTLAVVSDHGVSLLPPDFGRTPTPENLQELLRIPFFIHAPGVEPGRRDDPAQTIDLVPSLIDVLGIETDWELDGHSLFDGSEAAVEPRVGTDVGPALEVVARHHAQTPRGWDWTALAAVGEHDDLVGRPLSDLVVGSASALSWTPDHEEQFSSLPTADGKAPQLLTGVVESDARPPELVVVVNGTIGGALGGYEPRDGGWRFASFLGPYLRDGANQIDAYEVIATSSGVVLHRLG